MKKSFVAVVFVLLIACGGGGGSAVPPPPPPSGLTAIEQFTQNIEGKTLSGFFDAAFAGLLARSPESVVASTLESIIPLDSLRLNDWSETYRNDTATLFQLAMDKLLTYDRSALNADGQLEYDIFEWYLQDHIDARQFELLKKRAGLSLSFTGATCISGFFASRNGARSSVIRRARMMGME